MAGLPEFLPGNLYAGDLNNIFNGGSAMEPVVSMPMERPARPAGGCGDCPAVGMGCGSCSRKSAALTSEVSVFNKPGNLTTLGKLTTPESVTTRMGVTGSFPFRPKGETVRLVSSEKTCSQCGKNPTTCHCEGNLKVA